MTLQLSRETRLLLLKLARQSIRSKQDNQIYSLETVPDELDFNGGCFVTINLRNRLRGCIGNFRDDINIAQNISEMACQAAFADPRFGPVSKDELGMCEIEISVLSPMVKTTADEITVGRDGIYIIKGNSRGVLLPQVATERDWNSKEFLEQTCVKAGLSQNDWKEPDTEIYRFEALIFNENNLN
ncbi:MAG: AmmeMemoRadiSam system protein A [Denitrovibrio sp.]|nr:MAG: AmmeMemoRadiSam system protein A [Denitrovibrio sp.]